MTGKSTQKGGLTNWVKNTFPERQIFVRAEGRVRFITLASWMQIGFVALAGMGLLWALVTTYSFVMQDAMIRDHQATVEGMNARYGELSNGYKTLEDDLVARAARLEARQRFLEDVISDDIAVVDSPIAVASGDEAVSDEESNAAEQASASDAAETPESERAAEDGPATSSLDTSRKTLAAQLASIEADQRRTAERFAVYKQMQLNTVDDILADTKLTAEHLAGAWTGNADEAIGGPFVPEAGFEAIFKTDDAAPFEKLLSLWETMEIVKMALKSVPVGKPAEDYYISSKFGARIDPIKKVRANHPGLDLAGWPGSAILASAPGTVIHAAWYGPYGNMIEIDHGNEFHTRYGHLKRLRVEKGDVVEAGQRIGDMGKTGRVTDTHLHFEVWFRGQYIDPLPFLEAAEDVQQIRASYETDQ